MDARKIIISFAIVCALIFSGCASRLQEPVYIEKPVYIEIPVEKKIEIEPIRKPRYNLLRKIDAESSAKDVAEAYVNTIIEMKHYINQLESAIAPFYKKENNSDGHLK